MLTDLDNEEYQQRYAYPLDKVQSKDCLMIHVQQALLDISIPTKKHYIRKHASTFSMRQATITYS